MNRTLREGRDVPRSTTELANVEALRSASGRARPVSAEQVPHVPRMSPGTLLSILGPRPLRP